MASFRYRGREIQSEDISIYAKIEQHPNASRQLSTRLCEAWQWRQCNGALRDILQTPWTPVDGGAGCSCPHDHQFP
jgi:hypothetical protein